MRRILPSLYALLLLAACGSDSPTDRSNPAVAGTMTARIDGTAWSATQSLGGSRSGQQVSFTGLGPGNVAIGLAIGGVTGPGTYTIGGLNPTTAVISYPNGIGYGVLPNQGGGAVVITSLTSAAVAGTFTFTAVLISGTGAPATRTVAEGAFNVRF
ncbi:hypothetical protein BH23GEM9_BH23GEM9_28280 [soil metagenome]